METTPCVIVSDTTTRIDVNKQQISMIHVKNVKNNFNQEYLLLLEYSLHEQ